MKLDNDRQLSINQSKRASWHDFPYIQPSKGRFLGFDGPEWSMLLGGIFACGALIILMT